MNKRILSALVAISIVIVAGLAIFRQEFRQKHANGETIGAFFVPDLPDWKKDAFHSEIINNVTYTRLVGNDRVLAKFTQFVTPRGAQPPTAADLARHENESIQNADRAAHDKAKGFSGESESFQPVQFGKYPALLVQMHAAREGEAATYTLTLRFVNGHDEYWISIAYPENSPDARASAEAAWTTLQTTMQPPAR